MLEGKTFFDEKYVTNDCKIYKSLFRETDDALLDCLTQECLEIICCSCSIMVKSQLKDQLLQGKYYQPSEKVIKETNTCPRHNLAPERAFASLDAKKAIENIQAQITFRKKVLQQKFSNKKLLQLGETGEKGYKKLI